MEKAIKAIATKVEIVYAKLNRIQKDLITVPETDKKYEDEMIDVLHKVDDVAATSFGDNADINYLVYIQGLITMSEKFDGTPLGNVTKSQLNDALSRMPKINVQFK